MVVLEGIAGAVTVVALRSVLPESGAVYASSAPGGIALLVIAFFVAYFQVRGAAHNARRKAGGQEPVSPETLAENGLGPVGDDGDAVELYLDLVKRALINVLFHESSVALWRYNSEKRECELLEGLDLHSRTMGEDMPANAFTMVGVRRLDNIRAAIELVVDNDVEGDFIETGACKGGSCIYAKAVLRTVEPGSEPKVIVCDTFCPQEPPNPLIALLFQPILAVFALLAMIPCMCWKRALFAFGQKFQKSFPAMENPSDDMVDVGMFILRSFWALSGTSTGTVGTGLANVKSHFARFGLLDDTVVFLQGFFSDTLPDAPELTKVAIFRADGDSYESTVTALEPVYPKLEEGGVCIIDDYYSFEECRRAVDEYRTTNGIKDKIIRIDNMSVYWVKGSGPRAKDVLPKD